MAWRRESPAFMVIRPNSSASWLGEDAASVTSILAVRQLTSATTVNSPRGEANRGITSERRPRRNSSWTLVSSRPTETSQSPTDLSISCNVDSMRCGASKNMTMPPAVAKRENHFLRSFDRVGGNPRNENEFPANPDAASAATGALGPGMGSTRIPASMAARTRR
jgi:hypothetical protein